MEGELEGCWSGPWQAELAGQSACLVTGHRDCHCEAVAAAQAQCSGPSCCRLRAGMSKCALQTFSSLPFRARDSGLARVGSRLAAGPHAGQGRARVRVECFEVCR